MPEFLAETYTPRGGPDIAALAAGDITLATDHVSDQTAAVRLLGAIVVLDEETCFYLYQAPSADAVLEAMTRAGLQPGRITQATSIRWAAAVPAAAVRPLPEDM
jgi:hypothetical protein